MTTATAPNSAQQRTQTTTAAPPAEPTEFEKLLQRDLKFSVEYVPFLGTGAIKLSPQIVIRYFCKPTKAGHVCTEEQATRFIKLCQARALNPWEGDAFLVGYDTKDGPEFNLITAHQAFLKRAEAHDKYQGMESGVTVRYIENDEVKDLEGDYFDPEECKLVAGWARVHREDRKIATYRRLPLIAFNKGFGVWNGNAGGMICKCAECDALRSSFPNSLGGLYSEGELGGGATTEQTPAKNADAANRMSMRTPVKPAAPSPSQGVDSSPVDVKPAAPTAAPTPPTADGPPTWDELAEFDITFIREPEGIAVQRASDGFTLQPDGMTWRDGGWTVQPGSDEQDLLARQMAVKAVNAAPAPTAAPADAKPEPDAPKPPAPRRPRPQN